MPSGLAQGAQPSTGNAWKIGAIAGVLIVGGIFGCLVAVTVFGDKGNRAPVQTIRNSDSGTSFQQAFDSSFKRSCRQSAMRSGNVTQAVADNYCECALPVFKQTHDMAKVMASCKQYVMR